jgi:chemotaxis protein histidine kinase CheA
MAKQEVVIEVDIQGTPKVESMRTQMRKLREELARLPEGTAEFNRVQRQLGDLKDRMDDLGKSVNTVSGAPLERLNNSMSMIGSSILSLDFENALTGIKGMTSAMKDFKFGDLAKGAKSFGGTMFDLGKTLLMNPIFLLVSVLAAIILNFDKLVNAGGLVGKVFGFIKEQIDFVIDGITDFLNWTGLIDTEASARAEEAKKRNEEMVADLQKANDAVQKMRDDLARGRMTERQRELADIQKWYDDQLWLARGNADLQNEIGELARKKRDEINDKYDQIEADKRKKKRDEEAKKQKEDSQKVQDEMDALQEKWYQEDLDRAKKQQDLLNQIKREAIDEEESLSQEIQNIRQGAQATELQNLQDEYFAKIELAKKYGLDSAALEQDLKDKQKAINDKYRQEEEQKEKDLQKSKFEIAKLAVESMMSLNDLLTTTGILKAEESFKVGKALAIAQTTISTIMGVQEALGAKSVIPEPFGSALKTANAIAIGVAGAANIAKIAATKFNKGGGGSAPSPTAPNGGGGGMGGSTNAPALDLSFINQQTNQPQPLQAYVLATNVSSAQEANEKIKDQSRIIK